MWYYLRCGCFLEKEEEEDRDRGQGAAYWFTGSSSSSTSTACTSDVPGLEEESAQLGKGYRIAKQANY